MISQESSRTHSSALSCHPELPVALGEVVGRCVEWSPGPPSLAFVAASPSVSGALSQVCRTATALLESRMTAGFTSESPIGLRERLGPQAGLSLLCSRSIEPNALLLSQPFDASQASLEHEFARFAGLLSDGDLPVVIADPHSFDTTTFLQRFNRSFPGRTMSGGTVATGGLPCGFYLDGVTTNGGALVIVFPRHSVLATALSFGAKPVGQPLTVTKANGCIIQGLSSQSAVLRLEELMLESLSPTDLVDIAEGGLRLGVVTNEYASTYGRGDFNLMSIVDIDNEVPALTVTQATPVGSVVQFHIQSPQIAQDDLTLALAEANPSRVKTDMTLVFAGTEAEREPLGTKTEEQEVIADMLGDTSTLGASLSTVFGNVGGVTRELPQCTSIVLLKG